MKKNPCPVCGRMILQEYDICDVCGWENDPVQLANPTLSGGANHESLQEARKAWQKQSQKNQIDSGGWMIVEYIGDTYKVSLKKGKQYEATQKANGIYAIQDETGEVYGFTAKEFKVIEAAGRELN